MRSNTPFPGGVALTRLVCTGKQLLLISNSRFF